ncbi:hypothetical protein [Mycolicibacterium sp. XJ1819]
MAPRPFTADDSVKPAGMAPPEAEGSTCRHHLTVIASDVAEVVRSSGGWLCDQARAGWTVSVTVAAGQDPRPLRILGVTPVIAEAGSVLDDAVRDGAAGAVAVSAQMLGRDARLTERVLGLAKRGRTDVVISGEQWPTGSRRPRAEVVQHRLSAAARAFKDRALLAAAEGRRPVEPTETLYVLTAQPVRRLYSS